jgi:hypothetical protein
MKILKVIMPLTSTTTSKPSKSSSAKDNKSHDVRFSQKNYTDAEFIIFISCIDSQRSITPIAEMWEYNPHYLYGFTNKLLADGKIELSEIKPISNIAEEKFYKTNWDKFWADMLSNSDFPPFHKNSEELKKFYSKNMKFIFNPEKISFIFSNTNKTYNLFYETMPQLLCLIPMLMKLVHYSKNNIISIATFVYSYLPIVIPREMETGSKIFITESVRDNYLKTTIPDNLANKIYSDIVKHFGEKMGIATFDIEIERNLMRNANDILYEKLNAKKYDRFKPPFNK